MAKTNMAANVQFLYPSASTSLEQEALRRREKLKALREKSALAAQVRVFLILQYYNVYVSFIYINSDIYTVWLVAQGMTTS